MNEKKRSATYIVPGDPVPLARVRFGNRKAYDIQKPWKNKVGLILKSQHTGPLFTGPLYVRVVFYMPIPESYSLKRQRVMPYCYHFKRPDLSNLIKFIEDVCNEIVILDDSCICKMDAQKVYVPWKDAKTELYIETVNVYDSKKDFGEEIARKEKQKRKKK